MCAERHPEVVVHLAALAGVRPSLAEPARYADVNVTGTQRVLDAARAHGVRRFVFGSSSSVYGRDSKPPFKESDPCLTPLSPYAATKRAGELMLFSRPPSLRRSTSPACASSPSTARASVPTWRSTSSRA